MAKGQKRSNREARKPKQTKPKAAAAPPSGLSLVDRGRPTAGSAKPSSR